MSIIEVPQIVPLVLVLSLFAIGFIVLLRGLVQEITHCCKNQKKEKKSTEDVG